MGKSGASARHRGHQFERDIVKLLRQLGYEATTSRYSSRLLDDAGVDIDTNFPFNIQAKFVERLQPSPHEIVNEMPKDKPPVLFHKKANKGIMVTMPLQTFIGLTNP